jgi:hypothetical protein
VRGRRFVRPTLTISHKHADVRALADLEHKPWAAEDGEVWMAAFSVDEGLHGAREIELSVAPDIVVELRRKGRKLARPGDTLAAGAVARAPRLKEGLAEAPDEADEPPGNPPAEPAPPPRRRASASAELERLGARLASANHALEQERERRTAVARSLEEERTTNRQLRTELGQARSELEVAAAARVEASAMEAELEEARRQLRDAQRQHKADVDALTQRHEEATRALAVDHQQVNQAHAALEAQLRQQADALEMTREALAAERAETGRLHNRLAQLQEIQRHGAGRPSARAAAPPATRAAETKADIGETAGATDPGAGAAAKPQASRRASRAPARREEPDPTETQRFDVLGLQEALDTETTPPPRSRRAARRASQQTPDPPVWTAPVAERLRPLNPSLRHRTWWFGRLLALIVLCGVLVAVYLVLHTTVLH